MSIVESDLKIKILGSTILTFNPFKTKINN